ncbi:hypothetical protein EVAR_49957_1 [Eumeta japonica]|uniref:Uncharacterized protein n=1 Tax=Eumeta variegata TaxID=151549 RepID=A0A4C1XVE6_EUMVA|nr:hypothetical protein EVAR_49957_1 [Eumeta japonica]
MNDELFRLGDPRPPPPARHRPRPPPGPTFDSAGRTMPERREVLIVNSRACRCPAFSMLYKRILKLLPPNCEGCLSVRTDPKGRLRSPDWINEVRYLTDFFVCRLQSGPSDFLKVALDYGFLLCMGKMMDRWTAFRCSDLFIAAQASQVAVGAQLRRIYFFLCFSPCEDEGGEKPVMDSPCARAHGVCPIRTDKKPLKHNCACR